MSPSTSSLVGRVLRLSLLMIPSLMTTSVNWILLLWDLSLSLIIVIKMLEMPPLRVVLIVNQEVSCSPRALELNKLTSFGVSNKNPDSNSHSPVISIELSKKKKKKVM